MTLGSINALVASHSFFVPTLLDGLSIAGIPQLLTQVHQLRLDMGLKVELAGIIGTMTNSAELTKKEELRAEEIPGKALSAWPEAEAKLPIVLPQTLPKRAAFADVAGDDFAYIRDRDAPEGNTPIHGLMEILFKDMAERIGLN